MRNFDSKIYWPGGNADSRSPSLWRITYLAARRLRGSCKHQIR